MRTSNIPRAFAALLAGLLVLLLALPLLALASSLRASDFASALDRGLAPAMWLSFYTSALSAALLLVLGSPLAYWLARGGGRLGRVIETFVQLPAVTPPAVAGVALLSAFGRGGSFGDALAALDVSLPFTPTAVVLAQLFVAAPFYVVPATAAFRDLDEELLFVARSLGAAPARVFFRIALPLCAPALMSGLAIAWARALGEFGGTLVFAGNMPGLTQTLPIAIYTGMEGDLGSARAMAFVLLVWAVLLFLVLRRRSRARSKV